MHAKVSAKGLNFLLEYRTVAIFNRQQVKMDADIVWREVICQNQRRPYNVSE